MLDIYSKEKEIESGLESIIGTSSLKMVSRICNKASEINLSNSDLSDSQEAETQTLYLHYKYNYY